MATTEQTTPRIHDHILLRRIGDGAYGEVWLARSITGAYRAIKIVSRIRFREDRPFDREFEGIQKYEPLSRSHPGLVAILHVGRNEVDKYFFYIMELADDIKSGQEIAHETYEPKTLSSELRRRTPIPVAECFAWGITLADALRHLHQKRLIHRDIKPSNIIFVNGEPKFADVGLVTKIGESATFVGTAGYLPPEGPTSPASDIYSLGKVLYEIGMGKHCDQFPELPTNLGDTAETPALLRLNEIVLKACETDSRRRFQSAAELHNALVAARAALPHIRATALMPANDHTSLKSTKADCSPRLRRLAILYRSHVQPDGRILAVLRDQLTRHGHDVFVDKHLAIGVDWAREIEANIRASDAVIVLLSAQSVQSEMIAYEVETAYVAAQQQNGRPRLLPVRVRFHDPLPTSLSRVLAPLQYFLWEREEDDARLVQEIIRALEGPAVPAPPQSPPKLESIGGAVPLDSRFYVVRPTDEQFQSAIQRHDSIVLVKGARQMGKTSLLARGLQHARQSGARVVLTDFQKLNAAHLASIEAFFLTLGEFLSDQLELSALPSDQWDKRRSPNINFERFLRREVLGKVSAHFVWGLDEVDRLFTCDFGGEVFGLFRSWHNERALDPSGPWSRLTLAIAYATEAHLFITDINQSPFNVGTRLALEDFKLEQVADLNERYNSPLKTPAELRGLFDLLGGQPYLVRRALNELTSGHLTFTELIATADRDEGLFGDHLRRILVLLAKDPELSEVVRGILCGRKCPTAASFYRLRSAGVMAGETPADVRPRCRIYATYLQRHLL